eukprot:CAMPEP_0196782154 /NCGR_PEP_ID=MMETSP1104-20130614/10829_1 /TAXON_ID=33652 /ORGANISM="Cafeteria sp., Strain Caron Lab Isolate" /LENGTH=374 /DNA_ID=CAMNT_0042152385 /DNA_START=43 /DNA_END=1167 /DNA_ORIENTATION=-
MDPQLLQLLAMQQQHRQQAQKPVLEFRAGKMVHTPTRGGAFNVEAVNRKGKLVFRRSQTECKLQWVDRGSNQVDPEHDHLIFPDAQTFEKVDTGREGDRVYILQYRNSARRFFYWMQEPDASKDAELVGKLNQLLRDPTANVSDGGEAGAEAAGSAGASGAAAAGAGAGAGIDVQDVSSILQSMMGGAASAASATGAEGAAGATGTATAGTEGAAASAGTEAGTGSGGAMSASAFMQAMMGLAGAMQRQSTVPLNEVLRGEDVEALFDDASVRDALLPLLPERLRTEEELRQTMRRPQVQQALVRLSQALMGDQFSSIMASLNVDSAGGAEALARGDGIEAFVRALSSQEGSEEGGEEKSGDASGSGTGGEKKE